MQPSASALKLMTRNSSPSDTPSLNASGCGTQNTILLVDPICVPTSVRLMTISGTERSVQSLFCPEVRPPYISVTPSLDATSLNADAPPGPQCSSPQPAETSPPTHERNTRRCICHRRIAEEKPVTFSGIAATRPRRSVVETLSDRNSSML